MSNPEQQLRFHHVGIVVASIQDSIEGYKRSLGAEWDGKIFEDPNQKVRVTFLSTGPGQATVELVEPAGPDAPVQRFLNERGGGLHHVCYEVPDVHEQLVTMRARGAMIAKKPKPAVAFDGRLIAWVITAERLLIEYVEAPNAPQPIP